MIPSPPPPLVSCTARQRGVELTTGHVPQGRGRASVVYKSDSFEALEGLVRAMSKLGAQVRVTSVANGAGKRHEGAGAGA